MSLLPGCHWLRYPPLRTLKGTPPWSPCPGTSPPARLPARLPLARGAAGPSPSPVPSSSSSKTGNAMGLVRGSLRLAGLGGSCCFPVSRWHTPQPRDPEQAARQRPELYRAPGERGEAPPRRRLQGGGVALPHLAQGCHRAGGAPAASPPQAGSLALPSFGGTPLAPSPCRGRTQPRVGAQDGPVAGHPAAGAGAASAWLRGLSHGPQGLVGGTEVGHKGDTEHPSPSCRGGLILRAQPGVNHYRLVIASPYTQINAGDPPETLTQVQPRAPRHPNTSQ